ncbi:MAG: thioredoxin domain-containing protein [Anaerolineales bacterium]|nr:thioredoxin domain-containing protein [Anaerolineales bacterium]
MSKRQEIRERRRREQRQRRMITLGIIVGVALIFTALLIWPNFAPIGDIVIPPAREFPQADGVVFGDPDAPVLIEDYSDFQCSFCRQFHETTLNQIVSTYVVNGQVQFAFRQYPFLGEESLMAANASLCAAEQNKFWEYADILFANQTGVNARVYTSRRLDAFAEAIGLEVNQFSACLKEKRYEAQVQSDYADGRANGVQSTPSFFINGEALVGAVEFPAFQNLIDAALEQAGTSVIQN